MTPGPFDLPAYLARIGHVGPLAPNLECLESLTQRHVGSIPFENLDIQMGRPIHLDLPTLEAKLVRARRGGYCFEQNRLFAEVLRQIGFDLRFREARVRRGTTQLLPRTHLVLEVAVAGEAWLVDVGFGGDGLLGPVPFGGQEIARYHDRHRLLEEGSRQVLQVWQGEAWVDLYAVEPSEVHPVDLEMGNHYTSSHPESRFVQTLTVQLSLPEERRILRNLTLSTGRNGSFHNRVIGRSDLLPVLREVFDLELPGDARFRALEDAP